MTTSRRAFLGGAAALAVWPKTAFAGSLPGRGGRPAAPGIWEKPDGTATDCVMVRRLYLDLAGRIPSKDEAMSYAASRDPGKVSALADRLLASDDFANYWTMRFCDILRVKSEFPVNLWPNSVYAYHARIRKFVSGNEPWDVFGRALLTSQGSDFRDAEVNFFRATDRRTPDGWAEAVAQTFLGTAPAALPAGRRADLAGYLKNVRIKKTREWKEEIVYTDGPDLRGILCDRLFGDGRREVEDAFARRLRQWLFGLRASPAVAPDAPRSLRLKDALRGLVLSPAYARGSVTGGFPARRLDAEVLDDAFCSLSGEGRDYQSPAPEPFTFLPRDRPTVCVEDGSISSGFLSLFGRPARDTGLMEERGQDVTAKQRLYLFNSGTLHRQLVKTAVPGGWKIEGRPNPVLRVPFSKRAEDLYWRVLSRAPSAHERAIVLDAWKKRGSGKRKGSSSSEVLRDVAWCLVNSKEFLFRI